VIQQKQVYAACCHFIPSLTISGCSLAKLRPLSVHTSKRQSDPYYFY